MNVLNIEHVSKIFGDKKIFDDISYGIHDGDKIGIIGINGTGKSTLLKIIAGEEETDEGQVITQNGLRITYLPQMPDFPKGAIVQDYVADGKWQKDWSTQSEARNILNKLGITEHDALVEQLSGGQKKKVALARTLVNPSDVLILDEPTNHLDNEMVTWLEDYLNRFKGVVIMVTHDRYFLDKVTNKILEISHGKIYSYDANYSGFLELKAQREEMELAVRAEETECSSHGVGVGQAWLPRQKHQAACPPGASGSVKKRQGTYPGSGCADGFRGDPHGKENCGASPCFQTLWG